ncbi:MAG: hypothetical protein ABH818_01395 [Patescibacteria group bacterium]
MKKQFKIVIIIFIILIATFLVAYFFYQNKPEKEEEKENFSNENIFLTTLKNRNISNDLFDKTVWEIADEENEDLNDDGKKEKVFYLKTIQSNGDEEFEAKILIVKNNNILFGYMPSEDQDDKNVWPVGYYRSGDEHFYLQDLTGDNILEIILGTGFSGASDFSHCYSLIHYNKKTKKFEIINKRDFCSSFNVGIKITDLSPAINGVEIIKAIPSNGIVVGNKIEQQFDLIVYTWGGSSFRKFKRYKSSRNYEQGQNALWGEFYLLQKRFWTIQ